MPYYASLKAPDVDDETRERVAEGLLRLREMIPVAGVPPRTIDGDVLLATWNIREFDSRKYGGRLIDAFFYIAEIISHFDIVAIQEVREDLYALDRIQRILGSWWKYIVTDVTEGTSGNRERMAFMFDTRKVTFSGLAGEVVLPAKKVDQDVLQFARTPFVCGFKAGWSQFDLCTVHIYYGESKPLDARRLEEIQNLAAFLAKRAKARDAVLPAEPGKLAERNPDGENLILLGDFNIFDTTDATLEAITKAGFVVPIALQKRDGSNIERNKFYDQIAIWKGKRRLAETNNGGVLNYYSAVYRDEDEALYAPLIQKTKSGSKPKFKEWKTYQMSDHLVLWSALKVDFATEYLTDLKEEHS